MREVENTWFIFYNILIINGNAFSFGIENIYIYIYGIQYFKLSIQFILFGHIHALRM